jgi:mercuric ion binding protein
MKHLTLVTGLIVGMLFSLSITNQAKAQTKIDNPDIVIGVDGLACPFCAYGIEKKMKKLDGVEDIYVDINEGVVDLKLKKGATLAEEKIDKAVKDAGFTVRSLTYADKAAKPKKKSEGQ